MLDHLPWNPRHVRRFPSEDVLVCLEEGDKRAFLFVAEACPDQCRLGRVGRVERDSLDLLVGADSSLGCFLCGNFSFILKGGCGAPDGVLVRLCTNVLRYAAALLVTVVSLAHVFFQITNAITSTQFLRFVGLMLYCHQRCSLS